MSAAPSPGTMTNRIDQLVKAGFVERIRNPDDGRSVSVALTDAGFHLIDAAVTDHVAMQHRLTEDLSQREFTQLNRLIAKYLQTLGISDEAEQVSTTPGTLDGRPARIADDDWEPRLNPMTKAAVLCESLAEGIALHFGTDLHYKGRLLDQSRWSAKNKEAPRSL